MSMMQRMSSVMGSNPLSTPVGQVVERATSDLLMGPDWGLNMELCDFINREPECAGDAVKALQKQLRAGANTRTASLALVCAETCVKNCAVHMHSAMATKPFMDDMTALATTHEMGPVAHESREKALELIQDWGMAFNGRLPVFTNTYQGLLQRGVRFAPLPEGAAPIFTPKPSVAPAAAPEAADGGEEKLAEGGAGDASAKLDADLVVVAEKIKLCRDLLPESPGIAQDEVLSEVVGFLEACKPRMVALVEAGMTGALSEELLGKVLTVNDALINTLEAEEKGTPIPADGLATVLPGGAPEEDLLNVNDDGEAKEVDLMAAVPAPTIKSIAQPAPAAAPAPAPATVGPAAFDPFAAAPQPVMQPAPAMGVGVPPPAPMAAASTPSLESVMNDMDRILASGQAAPMAPGQSPPLNRQTLQPAPGPAPTSASGEIDLLS
mmetsp:Transcript_1987/g.5956  ORF Transcript_1987/g.5956 Transcript_1987/m.5956 type:complete len:438 (-) Transcript_1987:600-1913(-)